MSEFIPGPDLDPSVEYAFLNNDAKDALQEASVEGRIATMIGKGGQSVILAAGMAELSADSERLVILTHYDGPSGSERTIRVFGGLDPERREPILTVCTLNETGYGGENKRPEVQQRDADLYDRLRRLLQKTSFTEELAQDMIKTASSALGKLTADMGSAPTEESDILGIPQVAESEIHQGRMRRAATLLGALVRNILPHKD